MHCQHFFSRLRIVHSCKFLLNVSSMYGMCLCGINDTFKKVHTKSSEISKECKTWFNKISNCLSFQGKKGMEEICILKLNPENIGHLTLQ